MAEIIIVARNVKPIKGMQQCLRNYARKAYQRGEVVAILLPAGARAGAASGIAVYNAVVM